ncbi:low temperature requirement protein A [Microbacterium sp. Marseille-Q6965]|uniref:low temperature requirement protein A n=1 Tax=Microbacterium sp. Marseille-Q6965 TaxID=2965072 RepID=UPI0021B7535D|nr:low temperature requirement protein A [Microbacterium sp. Marseille-Q6965]
MVIGALRRRDAQTQRAATLELFYDLVFVFSLTQVSHLLLERLTWAGAGEATIVLLAVWWSWNYTTWATNELNPETNPVRFLLIALMAGSLVMAIAIPDAFGDLGLLFAVSYLAIQAGRHAFLTFVVSRRGTLDRERNGRILVWFLVAGVFWIAGGFVDGGTRVWLWILALALDYVAPLLLFPLPRRTPLAGRSWHVATEHFAERFGLFVIAALGETIVLTGATTAAHPLNAATVAAFTNAFAGTAALWWLYFTSTNRLGENSLEPGATRTERARDIYTYGHVLIVAAIILTAVGDELVIAHPLEPLAGPELTAVVAGPALFLAAQLILQLRATGRISYIRLSAITVCLATGMLGGSLPALGAGALLVATLIAVAVIEEVRGVGEA